MFTRMFNSTDRIASNGPARRTPARRRAAPAVECLEARWTPTATSFGVAAMIMMASLPGSTAAPAPSSGTSGGQATTQGFGMGTTITTTNQDAPRVEATDGYTDVVTIRESTSMA